MASPRRTVPLASVRQGASVLLLAVLGSAPAIIARFGAIGPRKLTRFVRQGRLALACLQEVARGTYRLPWRTVGSLAAALLYFLNPFDAVPDVLPLVGLLDDAAVLALVFAAAEADLRAYCRARGINPARLFD